MPSLQGTASKVLELTVGQFEFPSAAMESAAPVPRVGRVSVHTKSMGLWRPTVGLQGMPSDLPPSEPSLKPGGRLVSVL